MKVLLDINVVLDVVLGREPWVAHSAAVLSAADEGRLKAWVTGHTLTTVHYVTAANRDRVAATSAVVELLRFLDVVPVEAHDFHRALTLDLPDFEDAVQAACALKVGADYLVTRNEKDFPGLACQVVPPGALLAML